MLQNFSAKLATGRRQFWPAIGLVAWVLFGFVAAYLAVRELVQILLFVGAPLHTINTSVFSTISAAAVYSIALLIVIGVPRWWKKRLTSRVDIGLARLPEWIDLALAPAGFVVYLILSAIVMYVVSQLIPGFNPNETQELGFTHLTRYFEFVLAFVTLVIVAPVAEEVLFRGYLYGKLRKVVPIWVAVILTSALFGLIHGRWNVAIDVFVLSVVMCSLREVTGSIWAGILLHMMKNGLAFYLIFINPAILHTIGG